MKNVKYATPQCGVFSTFPNIFPLRFKHRVLKHNTSIHVLPLTCDPSSQANGKDRESNSVLYFLTNLHRCQNQSGGVGSIPDHCLVGKLKVEKMFSECFGFHCQYLSATAPYSFIYEGWNFNRGNYLLQLIQNRYMFRSFTLLRCSHQHCVQPVASDVEVVGYL